MLFFKECKKVICSLTFLLYVVVVIAMYGIQFGSALKEPLEAPKAGAEWYGTKEADLPEVVMPAAVESLLEEYFKGSYDAYPHMFYKQVKLKEKDSVKLAAILEELTGLTKEELDSFENFELGGYVYGTDAAGKQVISYRPSVLPEYTLSETVSYERFKDLMRQADDIIGGGSKYEEESLLTYFGNVAMTYEEALAEYEELMQEDNLAQAYFWLFSDYAGIVLAVIPVFVCVALWQLDKRSRMEALIYSRKRSSIGIVLTRYAALVCCMAVSVLLTMVHTVVSIAGLYLELSISFGTALGTAILWLLPNITVAVALGAFLTELVSPLVAIFVQGAWWYMALESTDLTGGITRFGLIIRHNTMGAIGLFRSQYADFVWNRWFYVGMSAVLLLATVLLYEWRRRGNGVCSISRLRKQKKQEEGVA